MLLRNELKTAGREQERQRVWTSSGKSASRTQWVAKRDSCWISRIGFSSSFHHMPAPTREKVRAGLDPQERRGLPGLVRSGLAKLLSVE